MSRPASAARYRCQTRIFSRSEQAGEAVRIELHDGGVVHALEEVAAAQSSIVSPMRGRVGDPTPSRSLHQRLQRVHRPRLAVHETDASRADRQRAEPAEDLAAIGVRRHRVDLRDARVHRDRVPVNLDLARAVDELTPAGARGLIADEEHRVPRIGSAAAR